MAEFMQGAVVQTKRRRKDANETPSTGRERDPRRPRERKTISPRSHVPRVLNGQLRCSSDNNNSNARRSARLAPRLRRTIDLAKLNKRTMSDEQQGERMCAVCGVDAAKGAGPVAVAVARRHPPLARCEHDGAESDDGLRGAQSSAATGGPVRHAAVNARRLRAHFVPTLDVIDELERLDALSRPSCARRLLCSRDDVHQPMLGPPRRLLPDHARNLDYALQLVMCNE